MVHSFLYHEAQVLGSFWGNYQAGVGQFSLTSGFCNHFWVLGLGELG